MTISKVFSQAGQIRLLDLIICAFWSFCSGVFAVGIARERFVNLLLTAGLSITFATWVVKLYLKHPYHWLWLVTSAGFIGAQILYNNVIMSVNWIIALGAMMLALSLGAKWRLMIALQLASFAVGIVFNLIWFNAP